MAGIFILSLDTELAWGTFDLGGLKEYEQHFDNWTVNTERLIELMEKYQISATWDFVGHLFLKECEKIGGVLHPDVIAPSYREKNKNWRRFDPGTNSKKDPYWYGRDILERVKSMLPPQEIATHTFSHVIMDNPECTKEVAYSEIKKCIDLAQKDNIKINTIIFPRNKVAHLSIVNELGIKTFRGLDRSFYQSFPLYLQRPFSFIRRLLAYNPTVYTLKELVEVEGVLEIPSSMFLLAYDGFIRKCIPSHLRFLQAKKGIESAIAKDSIFHLWFHPFNLGSSELMFETLENIFKLVREKIDEGNLVNLTMEKVTDEYYAKIGG